MLLTVKGWMKGVKKGDVEPQWELFSMQIAGIFPRNS